MVISKPAAAPQHHNQQRGERPRRQFTRLSMTLSQILPQLLKTNLVTLRDPPKNPNKTPSRYNPNARCAYHSDSPGHATDDCWTLRNKVQDLIDAKEVEFEAPETPNVIIAPLPKQVQTKRLMFNEIFNCNLFCCSDNYLLMSNFVSLMHCICLS